MGHLIVVGCGTVVPEADRGASCYYVDARTSADDAAPRVLFDCGPGAVQTMARLGVEWGDITDLVISHFHADHVGALPGLFFGFMHGLYEPRTAPLTVRGPVGTRRLFEALAEALGSFMTEQRFPLVFEELAPGDVVRLDTGTTLSVHETPHTDESVAYRLEGDFGSFGYSGDSGMTDTLGPFMAGVDALICECSLRDDEVGDNHLSPSGVAGIADAARPGKLILTHIYPHFRLSDDVPALIEAAGYDGRVEIAHEGLRLDF